MTGRSLRLQEPTGDEQAWIERRLAAADLPTADLRDGPASLFLATADGQRVGAGGLERYDTDGLLRSVVVAPGERGQGYGTALCAALEAMARDRGVETLYLLTTTAAPFFEACGYDPVPRDRVPTAIRETSEFTELCPDSATAMAKTLG